MKWKTGKLLGIGVLLSVLFCLSLPLSFAETDANCLVINGEEYCKENKTIEPKHIFENNGLSWGFDVDHRLGTPQLVELKEYISDWVRIKQMKMDQRRYLAEAWMLE